MAYQLSCRGQPRRGDAMTVGWMGGVTTPHRKNQHVTKCHTGPRTWTD
jgi:hypothetical protein